MSFQLFLNQHCPRWGVSLQEDSSKSPYRKKKKPVLQELYAADVWRVVLAEVGCTMSER